MALQSAQFDRLKDYLSRTPTALQTTQQDVGFFGEPIQDIQQTIGGIGNVARRTGANIEQITSSDATFPEKLGQVSGTVAGGISGTIGEVFKGGAKLALTRGGEQRAKGIAGAVAEPVMQSQPVQQLMEWYQQLPDNDKRTIDASLGAAGLALDVALWGGGKKLAEVGVKEGSQLAKGVAKSIAPVAKTPGRVLQKGGIGSYRIAAPMSESTKIAQQAFQATQRSKTLWERAKDVLGPVRQAGKPITEAETAAKFGLAGTQWRLGVQGKDISRKIWDDSIAPALKASGDKVNMKEFIANIRKEIVKNEADLVRKNQLLKALDKFSQDFKNVSSVSAGRLQQYKEGWAKFVPESYYRGKDIKGSMAEIRNLAAQQARSKLYELTGKSDDYIHYSNLKTLEELGRKSADQLRSKGITKQVWELIIDTAVVPVTTFGGKVLYRTGAGLEFIGEQGAKTVGDIVGAERP